VEELQEFCNLGYAEQCPRLPRERLWDSVRFTVRVTGGATESTDGYRFQVGYVCERGHLPAGHGLLEFDPSESRWIKQHPDGRVQRLAECFIAGYLERRNHRVAEAVAG
jgi:hypothetical protein